MNETPLRPATILTGAEGLYITCRTERGTVHYHDSTVCCEIVAPNKANLR